MPPQEIKEISWNEALTLASPFNYVLAVTLAPDGKPNIIGLGWWTICSWEPPMLAISVGRPRYSHQCLEHLGEFVLCFPADDQAQGAWLCGTTSGRDTDKFAQASFTALPAKKVKPPIIADCTVAFECRVTNKVETGDHTVYIGEILAMHATPGKEHHIYTIHYRKMVSLGSDGYSNFDLSDLTR